MKRGSLTKQLAFLGAHSINCLCWWTSETPVCSNMLFYRWLLTCSWKLVLTDFCLHFTSRGCSEGPRYCHNSRVSLHLPFPRHVMHKSTVQYRLPSLDTVASLPQSTHQTPFFFFFFCLPPSNPLFPSRVSQVDSNSWAGVGSHTSLRRALILRCCSWRLKSMIESEWNLAVRLQSTHTRPEASETLFTPGLALCL